MAIPNVNIDEVAEGLIGVQTALMASVSEFGEATVGFFLEVVPERGEKLWDRFRSYQSEKGGDIGFLNFVQGIVIANSAKIFYPKECILDPMTRQLLTGHIQKGISSCGIKSNDDMLQIYFGAGPVYEAARNVVCGKGCPESKCKHKLRR